MCHARIGCEKWLIVFSSSTYHWKKKHKENAPTLQGTSAHRHVPQAATTHYTLPTSVTAEERQLRTCRMYTWTAEATTWPEPNITCAYSTLAITDVGQSSGTTYATHTDAGQLLVRVVGTDSS